MKLKAFIKKYPDIYYLLFRIYLPIKNLRNRSRYDKHYSIAMSNLKKFVDKKIFFVGVPIHSNLGDQAQYYCIIKWLGKNYPDYRIVELTDNIVYTNYRKIIDYIKTIIKKEDFFVFQSGYRTTDIANFEGEYAHQRILNNFKNKVIVFPQTVNFKSLKEQLKSIKAYSKNNNYLFLVRDEISNKTAINIYNSSRVLLFPDIVTTLIGDSNLIESGEKKEGILMCLRNDEEKFYTNIDYEKLINKLRKFSDVIDVTDTNSDKSFEFNRSAVEEELRKKISQFSKYKLIITDRYHGTIFGVISNAWVIVLNSTDHKLSSGVNWFKNIYDNVFFCNSLDDVFDLAKRVYFTTNTNVMKPYFNQKYYDGLKEKVNEICK